MKFFNMNEIEKMMKFYQWIRTTINYMGEFHPNDQENLCDQFIHAKDFSM